MPYGYTLSLDMNNCNSEKFNRIDLAEFLNELCEKIDMTPEKLVWWDYENENKADLIDEPDHLVGTSVVQFITTSSIVIHTLDRLKKVYIDLFSCKVFSDNIVAKFCEEYFSGEISNRHYYERI